MIEISRRAFLETAVALGASAAWGSAFAAPSRLAWRERRDLYPEGVASGDPTVCIPRPVERSDRADGGPLACDMALGSGKKEKRQSSWGILEGDPKFSV